MKRTIVILCGFAILACLYLACGRAHAGASSGLSAGADTAAYQRSGHKSPKWDEFIELAFSSFESGNLPTAFVFLNRAHGEGCRDPLVLYRLAIYLESQARYPEAVGLMKEAMQGLPKHYPSHRLNQYIHEHMGRLLYQTDQFDAALPELRKAVEFNPASLPLLFMTAQVMRQKKLHAEARLLYEKALSLPVPRELGFNPRPRILSELVIITYELKDFTAAQTYYQELAKLSPTDPVVMNYKGPLDQQKAKEKEKEKPAGIDIQPLKLP